jgi:hypothetical protein
MALSVIGMVLAATGHLRPVSDAVTREVIDVLAVLNALRRAFPPRVIHDLCRRLDPDPASLDPASLCRGAHVELDRRGECMTLDRQIVLLLILPIPIASIAWTVTHEEVFREPRDWCAAKSKSCRRLYSRKFFYLFTCESCFSHYVTAFFLFITRYKLLFDDWRGYLVAGFSLVWLANVYMSFFGRLRLEIRQDRMEVAAAESREHTEVRNAQNGPEKPRGPAS